MKPVEQPPDFDALMRRMGQQAVIAKDMPIDLIKIFGERAGAWYDRAAVFDEDGRLPCWVHHQEVFAATIGLFFDERRFDAIFPQKKADETRMRAKRMMIKKRHLHAVYGRSSEEANVRLSSSWAIGAKCASWLAKG